VSHEDLLGPGWVLGSSTPDPEVLPQINLAAAADRLRESVGGGLTVESGRWATEHPRDAARRQLTDTEIDRAWAQGRTMGLEDAVAYVRTA